MFIQCSNYKFELNFLYYKIILQQILKYLPLTKGALEPLQSLSGSLGQQPSFSWWDQSLVERFE